MQWHEMDVPGLRWCTARLILLDLFREGCTDLEEVCKWQQIRTFLKLGLSGTVCYPKIQRFLLSFPPARIVSLFYGLIPGNQRKSWLIGITKILHLVSLLSGRIRSSDRQITKLRAMSPVLVILHVRRSKTTYIPPVVEPPCYLERKRQIAHCGSQLHDFLPAAAINVKFRLRDFQRQQITP